MYIISASERLGFSISLYRGFSISLQPKKFHLIARVFFIHEVVLFSVLPQKKMLWTRADIVHSIHQACSKLSKWEQLTEAANRLVVSVLRFEILALLGLVEDSWQLLEEGQGASEDGFRRPQQARAGHRWEQRGGGCLLQMARWWRRHKWGLLQTAGRNQHGEETSPLRKGWETWVW